MSGTNEINSFEDLEKVYREIEGIETPETPAQPEGETDGSNVDPKDDKATEAQPEPEQPAESSQPEPEYAPSFSYKVKDEERVFDDRFKAVIKSKADEDYIRDLYTRADGLPLIKEKLEATESKVSEYANTVSTLQETVSTAHNFFNSIKQDVTSGNIREAVRKLGIDGEALLRAAIEEAQEREMPEQQRKAIQAQRDLARNNEMILAEQQALRQQNEQLMQQQYAMTNESLISRQTAEMHGHINGKYSDLSKKLSDVGINMFDEAVMLGRNMFAQTGQMPVLAELVDNVASKYSKLVGLVQAPVAQPQQAPQRPAAIPKINGAGKTAVGQQYNSIDELRKRLDTISN